MGRKRKIALVAIILLLSAGLVYVTEAMKVDWSGWGRNATPEGPQQPGQEPPEPPETNATQTEPEPAKPEPGPAPEPEPFVNFTIDVSVTDPFPSTPVKGVVASSSPYSSIGLWRKLRGARNPYGEPHEWEQVASTSTDAKGGTAFILNPYTGKCGYWQYKVVVGTMESGVDELTVLGVYVEAILVSDQPQRHEMKICVYTSMPSASGAKVYESWDNWATESLTFENLVTDEAGFTYGNLITGMSGTVNFRAVGPDGTLSYNRFQEAL